METLRVFGHYSVVSEKVDKCPWKHLDTVDFWSLMIELTCFIGILSSLNYQSVVYFLIFLSISVITVIIGCTITDCWYSCGIKVKLKDNNHDDLTIKSDLYQFTDNPNSDALEIKTIVDGFEKYANEIDAANKQREEEKIKLQKECCSKYKSVIQKVK